MHRCALGYLLAVLVVNAVVWQELAPMPKSCNEGYGRVTGQAMIEKVYADGNIRKH